MVIEDEALLVTAIQNKLENVGMKADFFKTGEAALDFLSKATQLPDVIWLDYYLKDSMDGLEVLKQLKENKAWQHIPVIVVSNTANQSTIHTMISLGADKYLVKVENQLDEIVQEVKLAQ
jgi:CheY-like chemotaxis protein